MLHLSWVPKYHSHFNLSSLGKAYLIDDQSRGNDKQSEYVQINERAEKIVEGIVDEFCLIFSSSKAVSPRGGTWKNLNGEAQFTFLGLKFG